MKFYIVQFFFLIFICCACVNHKEIIYFQSDAENDLKAVDVQPLQLIKLKSGDVLGIMVSSLSPEASAMFNPYPNVQANVFNQTIQSNSPIPAVGFLVDETGNITLPLIGRTYVAGLTIAETTSLISSKLEKFLAQPSVNVRVLNFKVSILGEVNRPSIYTIPNEKITLPEAISLAGDLTVFGKRNNILLIRETDNKREFVRLDITKRDFFNSPYYYLKSNDIIYVQPVAGRVTSTDRAVQLAPIVISGLTLFVLVLVNFFK